MMSVAWLLRFAVANAVEAGKIGGCFGGCEDVVGRHSGIGGGEVHVDEFRSLGLQFGSGFPDQSARSRDRDLRQSIVWEDRS